jgi:hypothetical protein
MNELAYIDLLLTCNARTEMLHGREYVVCKATILREGVLNGSDGPLYYSVPEISKHIGMWNGVTIATPHPYIWNAGRMTNVSVNEIGMQDKFGIGMCRNDRMETDDKGLPVRNVDLWFDVENSNRVDGRIIPMVRAGEPVNVSTGIMTEKRQAVENSTYNGRRYTHTVHNIVADHLAILPDEKGACSVFDGCGININSADVLANWSLEDIQAVVIYNRDWPKEKRDRLSKEAPEDFAGPHQSFPIKTQEDVKSAASLAHHAKDPAAVKSKIKAIAKRKGLKTPEAWNDGTENECGPDGKPMKNSGTETEAVGSKVTKTESGSHVDNTWSDAAREASIQARERTHEALDWHNKNAGSRAWGNPQHLQKLAEHANRAVQSHIKADSKTGLASHNQAAKMHGDLAGKATKAGQHAGASLHSDAQAAHLHAGRMASAGIRNVGNSNGAGGPADGPVYGKHCPDCGGVVNQSTGECTKCGGKMKALKGGVMNEQQQLVSWLTTNCDCWKGTGSDTVLNTLSLEKLKLLKDQFLKAGFTDIATGIVRKIGTQVGFNPKSNFNNLPGFIANSIANAKKPPSKGKKGKEGVMEDDDEDDSELENAHPSDPNLADSATDDAESPYKDVDSPDLQDFRPIGSGGMSARGGTKIGGGKASKGGYELPESGQLGVMNEAQFKDAVVNTISSMTTEQYVAMAPPGVRESIQQGQEALKQQKVAIINQLTANITDPNLLKKERLNLWKKSLAHLVEILKYAGGTTNAATPAKGDTEATILNYFGQTGAPNTGYPGGGSGGPPTVNRKNVLLPNLPLDFDASELEDATE